MKKLASCNIVQSLLLTCANAMIRVAAMQAAAYYLGMLAYYWVLATPAVGFLFGCYLYIAVNWFHVHYDEAFSALRIPNFKGFSRLHINTKGDLEIYGLAMDKVILWLCTTRLLHHACYMYLPIVCGIQA